MSSYRMPHIWPTVVHMLQDAVRHTPEHVALQCEGDTLTYRQYGACVRGLAVQLREAAVEQGERVVVFMGNSLDTAIAIFAVQSAGAQVVPVNPQYTASELKPILENAQASGIIYDESAYGVVQPFLDGFKVQYCVGEATGSQRLTRWRDEAERAGESVPQLHLPDSARSAILQYTGGTTGVPKGVSLTHSAVATNVSQREALLPTLKRQERVLAITPLFHSYAMAMGLYLTVYAHSTLVILPRYRPDSVLDSLAKEQITLLLGSPTIFTGLMGFEGFAKATFSSLRLCSSGAAALPEETLRRWEAATGCPVCEGYGQTEAGPVIAYNPLHGKRKSGTVGVLVPNTVVEVVDVNNASKVLPRGEVGEIRIQGPQVMQGYYGMPQETAEVLRDGWLYTGDIGWLDEEGFLTISDRKKEMAIVSGFNVYPREIEEALFRHPGVREATVIGVPDTYRGEVLVAYVVADPSVEAQELMTFLSERLVKYKWPSVIRLVDGLPRTSVGKIDKKQLRATAQSQKN